MSIASGSLCTLTAPGMGSSEVTWALPDHVLPRNSLDERNQKINGFNYLSLLLFF